MLPAITGILYTFLADPVLAVPLILIEATGFAFLNPALYSVVAASSPPGRSSTTQGLFGAAGTLGFIAASLAAGVLAERSILYPFYVFSAIIIVCLIIGLAIGGQRLTGRPQSVAPPARRLTESGSLPIVRGRGVEQRQLVGLITRRSGVRIPSPQPTAFSLNPGSRPTRGSSLSGT